MKTVNNLELKLITLRKELGGVSWSTSWTKENTWIFLWFCICFWVKTPWGVESQAWLSTLELWIFFKSKQEKEGIMKHDDRGLIYDCN
jgi:hypothetical protein